MLYLVSISQQNIHHAEVWVKSWDFQKNIFQNDIHRSVSLIVNIKLYSNNSKFIIQTKRIIKILTDKTRIARIWGQFLNCPRAWSRQIAKTWQFTTMITFSRFRTQINEILNYKKINILQKASPGLLINEKKMRLWCAAPLCFQGKHEMKIILVTAP